MDFPRWTLPICPTLERSVIPLGKLKKELSSANLIIIGIAGAIGTGVLFSNAGMVALAGPGVVIAWIIGTCLSP